MKYHVVNVQKFYIRQTSKTLEIRMKQHKANVRSANEFTVC